MILVALGAVYAAGKFVPVYLQAAEVDSILNSYKHNASTIPDTGASGMEVKIVEDATSKIVGLGIKEDYLEVYFSDGLATMHADYQVVVPLLFNQSVTLELERSIPVPR